MTIGQQLGILPYILIGSLPLIIKIFFFPDIWYRKIEWFETIIHGIGYSVLSYLLFGIIILLYQWISIYIVIIVILSIYVLYKNSEKIIDEAKRNYITYWLNK
jgi:hypothetical protein